MLQKFKNVFLFLLILGMGYMLWLNKRQIEVLKDTNESIIDSLRSVVIKEESVIDSFSSQRTSIREQRDSTLKTLDTLEIPECIKILRKNMYEYNFKKDTLGSYVP